MEIRIPIRQAAERTGFSPHTLRYYERIGLLSVVHRDPGGRRAYSESDLEILEFVRRLRDSGMPLERIREYIGLLRGGVATGRRRLEILLEHEQFILARQEVLRGHLERIRHKIEFYQEHARRAAIGRH